MLHVVEQRGAHVEDEALADAGRVVALDEREPRVDEREEHRAGRRAAPTSCRSLSGIAVSITARRISGGTALDDRGEDHRDDEADELPAVGAREARARGA